ncbi:GNAT family protein [Bifidobacterium mongoliense]|uniref:GNAT family N-acetyltransferase n=1 Tax=Bifidobacterium mongoliense TaxID=518643 RepID=UPI0030ECFA34
MTGKSEPPLDETASRELPEQLTIPPIDGEMLKLRPAGLDDLHKLDRLEAFYNASGITGKDEQSERAAVAAWVRRSVAWSQGVAADQSGVGDPESRRTIAWSIIVDSARTSGGVDDDDRSTPVDGVIGMIFLIDIDGWARSARIQVVLGKDYRGRGYSRDAMPRVMTYGFAPEPSGLGMHRIWVAVPEKNTRSLSVYQSLGFEHSGISRDALWDAENGKYQDLNVLDTLVDEYDPIRSLDAFGMHVIEHNPGVREALSAREHSLAIEQRLGVRTGDVIPDGAASNGQRVQADRSVGDGAAPKSGRGVSGNGDPRVSVNPTSSDITESFDWLDVQGVGPRDEHIDAGTRGDGGAVSAASHAVAAEPSSGQSEGSASTALTVPDGTDPVEPDSWPYAPSAPKRSKQAWWRNFGRGHRNGKGE